jgi:hypothetical protein
MEIVQGSAGGMTESNRTGYWIRRKGQAVEQIPRPTMRLKAEFFRTDAKAAQCMVHSGMCICPSALPQEARVAMK